MAPPNKKSPGTLSVATMIKKQMNQPIHNEPGLHLYKQIPGMEYVHVEINNPLMWTTMRRFSSYWI
jgi:hypothetical protein